MRIDPEQLYWGNSGFCVCGEHLSYHARKTGKDRFGLPVEKVTTKDILDFKREGLDPPACERQSCSR